MRIGASNIDSHCEPFVILEAGINHNGELPKALEMIRVAKQAGADAIKFQTFKAEEFVADPAQLFTYRSQGREVTESMLGMFLRYQFAREDWFAIKKACDDEEIMFLSTPQNVGDLELLLEIGVCAVKVGSDDFTNLPLLRSYAKQGLPLILSCGMADLAEVHQALEAAGALAGKPTALLVCTSEYPAPPQSVNIARLTTLAGAFPEVPLGFSDHTRNDTAAIMAVALGAKIFEKHFTLGHDLPGPDHWFSLDPAEATRWIASVREAHVALGSGRVAPSPVEAANRLEFRRMLVAARPIAQGEIFDETNLTARRIAGGVGLPVGLMEHFIGRPAHRAYKRHEAIEI